MASKTRMRLEGLGLLLGGLGLLCLGVWQAVSPFMSLKAAHDLAVERTLKFKTAAERPVSTTVVDSSGLIHRPPSEDMLSRQIQRLLSQKGDELGLRLNRLRQEPLQQVFDRVQRLDFLIEYSGDLQSLNDFLAWLQTQSPMMFVDQIEITTGSGPRPDMGMSINARIIVFFETEEIPT